MNAPRRSAFPLNTSTPPVFIVTNTYKQSIWGIEPPATRPFFLPVSPPNTDKNLSTASFSQTWGGASLTSAGIRTTLADYFSSFLRHKSQIPLAFLCVLQSCHITRMLDIHFCVSACPAHNPPPIFFFVQTTPILLRNRTQTLKALQRE